jgi:PAS domain S-box-containing protein
MAQRDVEISKKPATDTEAALIEEIALLRCTVRDLVALSALPTLWTAPDLPRVAESLADALLSTIRLEFVVVCLKSTPGGDAVEAIRVARSSDMAHPEQAIHQALAPWLDCDGLSLPSTISNPLGSGTVQVAAVPIGDAAELGMLIAGSHRSDFPTETDRLLLRVGANQPAIVLARWKAEEALHESEERFRSLTQIITPVVWTTDAEGRFVTPQPSWAEFTGQTWEELRDFGWANALHPDDRERVRELWGAACASKTLYTSEGRLWHAASGSYRHFEARGVPILKSDGSVREWVGTCLDVEDRKRAMKGIERQREDLESLIMQSPVPICVLKGPDLVYEMANAAYLEVVGGRDILGKPLLCALPEFRGQGYDEVLRGVMRAGEPVVGRETLVMLEREGRLQETYWTFIYSPLRDADGSVNRVVALCDDVTEQRRLMNELIEADRRKDEFLATLAHELRNPLAPLRSSVQLLRHNDSPSPELQRATDVIDRQVHQLVRLVDDLLDVSRITLDKLELRKEQVTLARVVQAAVEASRPLIEKCGHELTVTLPPEPVDLDADLTRLAQVFLNLLNNAAKYTEPGGHILLAAEREGGDVVVIVKDSGIGIAADMLPRVFEMFVQVDQSLDRSQGGLGIGLTLVKRLVQLHGGSIEARSEGPGKGSEFVVRLPVAIESSPGAHPVNGEGEQPAPIPRHRILVVDDNRDAAEMLAELLELMGNDLRTAHDGVEAVEVAGEFRPDVVLLDIGLPKMNGYEVAEKIREQPWGKAMVLVALTGWGQEEDRRRSREAGFDHHLIKPVEPDALLKLLTSISDGRCSAQ